MPFFSKVFRSRDGTSASSKKQAKLNGNVQINAQKPQWTDAWLRTQVNPEEVQELLTGCTHELKSRALDMPFLLLPFRPTSDPSAARTFVRHFFNPTPERGGQLRGENLAQELRLTEPMVLCSVMKWCWGRLPGGVVTWEAYELFKVGEHDSHLARDAFATFIPISVESDARSKIIFDFFDLMAAIAAHGKTNGLGGRKLSRFAGWWAFEHSESGKGFDTGYKIWASAADATSHLFFAYLRSLSPDSALGTNGIMALPISLQTLVQATEYPPEAPSLMQNSTTKVVMIVDTVSPTPFALLRRAKNFEYRDDDRALQQFSNYDDPVQALTDECRRVLKCISSTNQSSVSTSKASTSLRDASWSRFEDIGFGGIIDESDAEEEGEGSVLSSKRNSPQGLRAAPRSRTQDLGRPTTPSWADFLSSGFADEAGGKSPAPLLLPPDKILPPIHTTRGQSSQSHKRMLQTESPLEPGELASINRLDLDDSFWWVWISSLAGEEPTGRKAVFGRCALIETKIKGGRWLIMEEQVKGAAPEPGAGAYIAEKKGFFGFTTKGGRLTRRKSGIKKSMLSEEPYRKSNQGPPTSKTSIGPDQHARIQAAAAALQQRNKPNEVQQNGFRRGRADDTTSAKTTSVFTLQPVIMNEASPAMKWANNYDKNAIRAAYLGNNLAGRGGSSEVLNSPTNNIPIPDSEQSRGESQKDRGLPALPQEKVEKPVSKHEPQRQAPPVTPPPLQATPSQGLNTANNFAAEAAEVPLPATEPLEAPQDFKPDDRVFAEAAEAAEAPLPAAAPLEAPQDATRNPPPEPVSFYSQQQPVVDGKKSTESDQTNSPPGKRLKKKTEGRGFKGMFGKKKTEAPAKPSSPESSDAIAAARAALEGRTKQPQQAVSSMVPPKAPTSNRFSGLRRKNVPSKVPKPAAAAAPAVARPATPPKPVEEERQPTPVTEEETGPVVAHHDDGAPRTNRDSEYDTLSRVDTNERLKAEREFSSFDQGPLVDQPSFVPAESPNPGSINGAATPVEGEPQAPAAPAQVQEAEPDKQEELTRQISPVQDRWAQIRKNAAERAARQSEEHSGRSATEKTDDGETSGEETIESRVARIKARVAELTGNMESARR